LLGAHSEPDFVCLFMLTVTAFGGDGKESPTRAAPGCAQWIRAHTGLAFRFAQVLLFEMQIQSALSIHRVKMEGLLFFYGSLQLINVSEIPRTTDCKFIEDKMVAGYKWKLEIFERDPIDLVEDFIDIDSIKKIHDINHAWFDTNSKKPSIAQKLFRCI